MKHKLVWSSAATIVLIALAGPASSATTYAETYAAVDGTTPVLDSNTAGAGGATASSALTIAPGTAFVDAQARALPGSLHAVASARALVPTSTQADAIASWSDSFQIASAGHAPGETGRFDASVSVSGGLLAEIVGLAYADSYVTASATLDPHTGYNGGVSSLSGGGRYTVGYDIGETRSGSEAFTLFFIDVPFTFGQDIDLNMRLAVVVAATSLSSPSGGDFAHAEADFAHTMTWDGLTRVRDAQGLAVSDFSAVSASSGYDFANAVPEPEIYASLLVGLGLLARARRRLAR